MPLKFGRMGPDAVHLCVDMQRLFAAPTPWHTPWMARVTPSVLRLAEGFAPRNVFTRFLPAQAPTALPGTWQRYYERWPEMTGEQLSPELVEIVPELASLVEPGWCFDKPSLYSPWDSTQLHQRLRNAGVETLVFSGGETEVCVMATMIGAIDRGYRVVLVTDALCSSADETHDAMLRVYASRFGMQIETALVEEVLSAR